MENIINETNSCINEIIESYNNNELKNSQFNKLWCNGLVKMVLYQIAYVIEYSKYQSYDKDLAVIYGLMKEMFDTLVVIEELMCKGCFYNTIALSINRIFLENAINLNYLIDNHTESELKEYRLRGLKHTIYYLDEIQNRANTRGYYIDWENRLMSSIQEEYNKIGANYNDIKAVKNKQVKELFNIMNNTALYNVAYRTLSTSVHSGWEYISKNMLDYNIENNTFKLKKESKIIVDIRLLDPLLLTASDIMINFCDKFKDHIDNIDKIKNNFELIRKIVLDVEVMHLNFIEKKPLLYGVKVIGRK